MTESHNKALIQDAFDAWRAGTGGPFRLLAPNAHWTIANHSVAAGEYRSREEFIAKVIEPFNARLAKPLVPTLRRLYAEDDTVIALFDAEATTLDGQPYRNSYAWFMELHNGHIVNTTAFFDSTSFDELWRRVEPHAKTTPGETS